MIFSLIERESLKGQIYVPKLQHKKSHQCTTPEGTTYSAVHGEGRRKRPGRLTRYEKEAKVDFWNNTIKENPEKTALGER